MPVAEARALARQFFRVYPDYSLCRVLVENVEGGVITRERAYELLQGKATAAVTLRESIRESLDKKKVALDGHWHRLRDLALADVRRLDDTGFREVLRFYFKYPYAHDRLGRPAWYRTRRARLRFLYDLLAEGRRRSLAVDYPAWEEMLSLL